MRDEVTVDGVRLTREQVERASQQLNMRNVTLSVPRDLLRKVATFLGWNVTLPELLEKHGTSGLKAAAPSAAQMGEFKCIADAALYDDSLARNDEATDGTT